MYNYCTQTHNQNLFHSQEIYFIFIRHFYSAAAFKSLNKLAPYFAGVHEILKNFQRSQFGSSTKSLLIPGTVFSCFSVKLLDPQRKHWTMLAEHTAIWDLMFNTKAAWTYWSRRYWNLFVYSTLCLFTVCHVAKGIKVLHCWNNHKSCIWTTVMRIRQEKSKPNLFFQKHFRWRNRPSKSTFIKDLLQMCITLSPFLSSLFLSIFLYSFLFIFLFFLSFLFLFSSFIFLFFSFFSLFFSLLIFYILFFSFFFFYFSFLNFFILSLCLLPSLPLFFLSFPFYFPFFFFWR